MADKQWFFVENGERAGPVGTDELSDMALHGVIAPETLVWADGMADWEEASAHFDFAEGMAASTPPPLTSSSPPDDLGFPLTSANRTAQANSEAAFEGGGVGPDGLYVGAPSRGFGEAIKTCLSKYFTFSGRASRSEYWFFYLFLIIVSIVGNILDTALIGLRNGVNPINSILSLLMFFPGLSVTFRRLHDTGRSGWWIGGFYLALLAYAGLFALLISAAYGNGPDGALVGGAIVGGLLIVTYTVTMLVFLCKRGTPGQNRYG